MLTVEMSLGQQRVQARPPKAQLRGDFAEIVKAHRLDDMILDPKTAALGYVPIPLRRGQQNHRDLAGPFIVFNPPQNFQAADFGQMQIQQHHLGSMYHFAVRIPPRAKQEFQRFLAIA